MRNLAAMDIVGTTEAHDTYEAMLGKVFEALFDDASADETTENSGVGSSHSEDRKVTLPTATLEAITKANEADARLYQMGQQLAAADASCLGVEMRASAGVTRRREFSADGKMVTITIEETPGGEV